MSNVRPNPAAEINLEEFERRLRAAAAPQAGAEDPLAELTRLVDTIGFERTPSERALEATRPPKIAPKPAPLVAEIPPQVEVSAEADFAPKPDAPKPDAPKPEVAKVDAPKPEAPKAAASIKPDVAPKADFPPRFEPAASPLLRPSFGEADAGPFSTPPSREEDVEPIVATVSPASPRPRGRYWGLTIGGLVAAALVMIVSVAVLRFGHSSHSGAPPLILASTAPTKVAPPSEETVRTANETGSLLTRDTAQPTPTPPKLVAPPEAPVDLAARPQPTATATAEADASPVAPSSQTPIVARPPTNATPAAPVGADPSRVKTISVRPDGTLISSGFEANSAPTPTPSATPSQTAAVDGEAATPAPALPTKLAPPKSAARVVSKTDTTAPADQGAGPVPVKPKKPKPTPSPTPTVVEAEPRTDDAKAADPKAGDSAGGYSVQLAAPNNRADADELVKKAQARYADALGGASVGVRKADRHGDTIYRVRVLNLTKAQASAMCAKIKASGGDCFAAKN